MAKRTCASPRPACSIEGCESPSSARGWCTKHYTRWQKYGDPLALKQAVQSTGLCLWCGSETPPTLDRDGHQGRGGRTVRPAYCSKRCQRRASYERRKAAGLLERRRERNASAREAKSCPVCGVVFTPATTMRQKYCSKRCGKKASNAATRARRPDCSADGCSNRSVSGGLCWRHHPNASGWKKDNPKTRRASLRTKTQLRRARLRDPDAEPIDRDEIGERDRWRCGLCGKKVNRRLAHPHPRSASLDHIVPLAEGGRHVKTNVQIAHLECNIAKGARGGGEQLLLIG